MLYPPRVPLLPLLRVTLLLAVGGALFWGQRRPPTPTPTVDVVWASDVDELGPVPPLLGVKATTPLEGQKRPPCAPRREREVVGACWIPHAERPPCPEGTYEGPGVCLVPVKATTRPPTSLEE